MSHEYDSEPGEATFRSVRGEPQAHSPEAAAPSQGKQKLSFAPTFSEAAVDVPDAESQQAASEFHKVVADFMLAHAGEVKVHEMVDGYPTSHVDRKLDLEDGSDVRVSVVTRGEGIPKEVRGPFSGEPIEISVRTFKGRVPGRQLSYRLDGKPPVVRREENDDPMGSIARALEAVEGTEAELGEEDLMASLDAGLESDGGATSTASNPIARHLATERTKLHRQEEMGLNNRKIGLGEVSGLKRLLAELS